nr:uncharacterized protein LOC125631814 [Caretta caretta]
MKGHPVRGSGTYSERFRAFSNGSLSVCPMQPGDEGQYTAEVFDHDGAGLGHQKIQLEHSGNKTAPVQEVTGIVGGSVLLPLAAKDWNDLVQIMWKKDSMLVAELNYSQSESNAGNTYRSQILSDGTLRLDRLQESDCGRYSVEVRNRDGKIIYQRMIDVKVEQETVASPVNLHLLLFTIVGVHVAVFIVVLGSLIWHFRKCKHRTGRMTNLSCRHVTLGRSGYDEDLVECGEGDMSSPDQGKEGPKSQPRPVHAGNDVASVIKDCVPLKNGNYIPQDDRDFVPPAFDDCVPPAFDDCVPPAFDDFVPPAFDDFVPPAFDDFVPPAFDDCVPPAFDDCVPPAFDDFVPPAFDDCVPPAFDDCVPPAFDDCVPPAFDNCDPSEYDDCGPPAFNDSGL